MTKIKLRVFCLVLAVTMLSGMLVSNAASSNLTCNLFYSKGVSNPIYYYLDGISTFKLTKSDMKSGWFSYSSRKKVQHKLFASDDYLSIRRYSSGYSSGENYKLSILYPEEGGAYGSNPAYVAIQEGTFKNGIEYGMYQTVRLELGMRTSIGDTWCKEEIIAWVYDGPYKNVKTINLLNAKVLRLTNKLFVSKSVY